MKASFRYAIVAALIGVLFAATSAFALEKQTVRFPDDARDQWRATTTTCTLSYYNTCTGWIWVWSGWSPGDMYGTCFTTCCTGGASSNVVTSAHYITTSSPSGYNFTGSIDVWNADGSCCPTGSPLATQAHLNVSGWNIVNFVTAVPVSDTFVITFTASATGGDPHAVATDHPAAGPVGPAACGYCYPTTRVTYSFYYGLQTAILCPGSPLDDGLCYSELVWEADVDCVTPVESSTWGTIKGLYR